MDVLDLAMSRVSIQEAHMIDYESQKLNKTEWHYTSIQHQTIQSSKGCVGSYYQ